MNTTRSWTTKFFGAVINRQTYLNLVYLFLAFPLGILYSVLLVLGFSLGFGLLIIWVGAIILALTYVVLWDCTVFERNLAVWLLHENIPPISRNTTAGTRLWERTKANLSNPVTWKSLAYLLVKLPLGTFTFIILVTLLILTLGFLAAPAIYPLCSSGTIICGSPGLLDASWKAILFFCVGVALFFPTLHAINGLAGISGRLVREMLS